MEGQVPQVSPAPLVDQESLADPEHRDCQATKAKQVVMEFQDHQESKESPVSMRKTKSWISEETNRGFICI